MKLISMKNFCLQLLNGNPPYNEVEMLTKISNYANFLNQKLSVDMFIKTGEEDTVLFKGFSTHHGEEGATDCYTTYLDNKDLDIFVGYKKDWEDDWVILEDMEFFQNYESVEFTDLAIDILGI